MSDLLDGLLDVLYAGGGLVSHHHRLPLLLLTPQARLNTSQSISISLSITSHLSAVGEGQVDDISNGESSSFLEAAIVPERMNECGEYVLNKWGISRAYLGHI